MSAKKFAINPLSPLICFIKPLNPLNHNELNLQHLPVHYSTGDVSQNQSKGLETGDRRKKTGDVRQENRRRETGERRQEKGDRRKETEK